MNNREKGRIAENLAEAYYRFRGYRVVARNFHSHYGEIDLILEKGRELRIVEVKSSWYRIRDRNELGNRVTRRKIRHLAFALEKFLSINGSNFENRSFIFEVLFVLVGREHIEFLPFSAPAI